MTDGQWCLYSTERSDEWTLVAALPSLADAIHRLRQSEVATHLGLVALEPVDRDVPEEDASSLFVFSTPLNRYAIRWEP